MLTPCNVKKLKRVLTSAITGAFTLDKISMLNDDSFYFKMEEK